VVARTRGTDPSRAHIGMDLFGPARDFAGLARSMGWWAEGPIENADDLQPALQRAVAHVKSGEPALVDAVTRHRCGPNSWMPVEFLCSCCQAASGRRRLGAPW
jgi:acetolactate synthase I/II/III large subunit